MRPNHYSHDVGKILTTFRESVRIIYFHIYVTKKCHVFRFGPVYSLNYTNSKKNTEGTAAKLFGRIGNGSFDLSVMIPLTMQRCSNADIWIFSIRSLIPDGGSDDHYHKKKRLSFPVLF